MLYEVANARSLGWMRICIFAMWLEEIAVDPFHRIAELPLQALSPVG